MLGPRTLLVLCVLVQCSCAAAPATRPTVTEPAAQAAGAMPASAQGTSPGGADAEPPCPRSTALEVDAVRAEVVCLLQRYVRLDTTNPPGNEWLGAGFLKDVLAREGIEARIIEAAKGRANLLARLPGSQPGKALLLVHHMDVVPARAQEWSVPPFAAELRDGYVWGRGSLDNKAAGIVSLMTMLMLKRLNIPLQRDLVLLGVADEEAGGGHGARFLMEHHFDLFEDVAYVLNEGGAILQAAGGRVAYGVELAQKAPLWLRATATGRSGHGSAPSASSATHTLIRALSRLEAHRFAVRVLPAVQAMFSARAQKMPAAERARYENLAESLRDPVFAKKFLSNPRQAALVRNTLSITMLEGSGKENVLPGRASAVLDMRLLPGEDAQSVIAELQRVIAEPAVKLETLLSWQGHTSARDTPLFAAIEAFAAERDPGATVGANVIGGFTDCNAFRAKGMTCYGFMPIRLRPGDLRGMHGADERIAVASVAAAVGDMVALIGKLCRADGRCTAAP